MTGVQTCALPICLLARRGLQGQGAWPRAERASLTDSPRLFERSERSERSEFCGGPCDRAPERSRREAATAEAKRRARPARAFAAPTFARDAVASCLRDFFVEKS